MALDPQAFDLDVKPRETYWPLDPDIDLDASNLQEWLETGDGLVAREKGKPSVIRWRPITLPEQSAIYEQMRGKALDTFSLSVLCVSYGLISVDGLAVETDAVPTGRRVKWTSTARLEQLSAEVPGLPAIGADGQPMVREDGSPIWARVSPIVWLGGLISAASFRKRG